MAKKTTADIMLGALADWGVAHIFGLPGDGINGLMEALRVNEDIRFIQTRHEESAAFMACAYAKFTGKLGVCIATSGPGGIHLLNGLYDAKLDGQPVLAITGMQHHDLIGTHTQQDVELDKLFADVARYNQRIMGPGHARPIMDLACREALANRTVSHVTIPVDVQSMPCDSDARSDRNVPGHSVEVFARARAIPSAVDLTAAAEILNAGEKVMILAGQGALGATDALEAVAARLKAPVGKALLGKGCLPDDSPYSLNSVGLLGTRPSQDALEGCDTLLIVGSSFPYVEFYPAPSQARIVQIDIDAARIGLRCPVEQGLVGDSGLVLEALLPHLNANPESAFLEKAQEGMRDWWALMETRGAREDIPMKPQVVAWELGKRLPDNAIVVSDSGTIATWFARQIPANHEGEVLESHVTKTRHKFAALAFIKQALKRHGRPEAITTDGLRSYGAAMSELGNAGKREVGRWANNLVENSHLPFRRRERAMSRFLRMKTLQKFASVHASLHNHSNLERHLVDRQTYRERRSTALAEWHVIAS